MQPYTYVLTRPLDWQRNKATKIHAILRAKEDWYQKFYHQFWTDWRINSFDLTTANKHGMIIWSYILGLPAQAFASVNDKFWAFGDLRENFVDVQTVDGNTDGGNFVEDQLTALLDYEATRMLRLRYYSLVLGNTIPQINAALLDVFGRDDQGRVNAWVVRNGNIDLIYRHRDEWSSNFINSLNNFDILPRPTGAGVTIEKV